MISITRGLIAPADLSLRGGAAVQNHISSLNAGAKKIAFESSIYASLAVKSALRNSQHSKCCYCEKSVVDSFADVEHYRPKTAIKAPGKRAYIRPGYYWLAYEWSNLLLACETCNRSFKKNRFPLASEINRANPALRDTSGEEPLIINPVLEDPELVLGFRAEYPYPVGNDIKARVTIDAIGLAREPLNERRRTHLATARALWALAILHPPIPESAEARQQIKQMVSDEGEFAACTRRFLNANYGRMIP